MTQGKFFLHYVKKCAFLRASQGKKTPLVPCRSILATFGELLGTYVNSLFTLTCLPDREEDLKYLEFVADVTNDVLDRGIFTDRYDYKL